MTKTKELLGNLQNELKIFAENPDEMYKHWERTRKQFYNYSLRNLMIANGQMWSRKKHGIEQLASYKKWQNLGRQVKKGEKGLKILAPIMKKNQFDENEVVGYRTTTVFDINQTKGKDLFFDGDIDGKIDLTLQEVIKEVEKHYPVYINLETEMCRGKTDYKEIRVSIKNKTDTEKIAVIFHELAHIWLNHKNRELETSIKELEAESVSYIVCKYFGVTNKQSVRYIFNWSFKDVKNYSLENANKVVEVANKIINLFERE